MDANMVYAPVQPPVNDAVEASETSSNRGKRGRRWVLASTLGLVAAGAVAYVASTSSRSSGIVSSSSDALRGRVVTLDESKASGDEEANENEEKDEKKVEETKDTEEKKAEDKDDADEKEDEEQASTTKASTTEASTPNAAPSAKCYENGKPARFIPPPKPKKATEHNGVKLEDVCVTGDGPYHVFIIGDWGGLIDNTKDGKLKAVSHLNHRWNETPAYSFHWPVDEDCQFRVRDQMRKLAPKSKPAYVLNMGDNFYWGGVEDFCGADDITVPYNNGGTSGPYTWAYKKSHVNQFEKIFEEVYTGEYLDGLQWLGVLGNHDWGGWEMNMAWDQAIGYTWAGQESYSTDRWMTPALYYYVTVKYPDFAIQYYFMDTNVFDALPWDERPPHNICGPHNPATANCGATGGPTERGGVCQQWFDDMWADQKAWLKKITSESDADWRAVVTHFPPYWGREQWPDIAKENELDAVITGHRHSQNMHHMGDPLKKVWEEDVHDHLMNDFLDPTCWIVSGGGGGITSEHSPHRSGEDDQYGFLDMTLTKEHLQFDMYSHAGVLRHTNKQPHYYSHGGRVQTVPKPTTTTAPPKEESDDDDSEATAKAKCKVGGPPCDSLECDDATMKADMLTYCSKCGKCVDEADSRRMAAAGSHQRQYGQHYQRE